MPECTARPSELSPAFAWASRMAASWAKLPPPPPYSLGIDGHSRPSSPARRYMSRSGCPWATKRSYCGTTSLVKKVSASSRTASTSSSDQGERRGTAELLDCAMVTSIRTGTASPSTLIPINIARRIHAVSMECGGGITCYWRVTCEIGRNSRKVVRMTGTQPVTRRRRDRKAQLAELAADLFRRNGYHAVGIGDIAAAAGITGPAVYRHFSSKQDILGHVLLSGVDCLAETVTDHLQRPGTPRQRIAALTEAIARLAVERRDAVALWRWLGRHLDADLMRAASTRMVDRLLLGAAQATAGAADADEALDRLIDSYAEIVLAHRDLMAVYIAEVAGLPPQERAELQRPQRTYVSDWVRLVATADPRLEPPESRVVVHAALTLATDLARTGRLLNRPGLQAEIATLMRAVAHRPHG